MDDERVELSGLDDSCSWGSCQVLLLVLASLWVLVVHNQVNLVGGATLVGTEHDDVWRGVGELILVKSLVVAEKLQVSTTTLKTICEYVSEAHCICGEGLRLL